MPRVGQPETLFEATEPQTAAASSSGMVSTEMISAIPSYESIVESVRPIEPALDDVALSVKPSPPEPHFTTPSKAEIPDSTQPANEIPPLRPLQVVPTDPSPSAALEAERRTVVMEEQLNMPRPARGKIMGWLISYTRNPDGEDFRVYAGYNRLGANPICDIVIQDETVSGSHAILVYRDGRCLIKDDLSRNGTYVNGREITEAYQLQNYDQVRIGNTVLTYISAQRPS